ncbi:MAG TPA: glycosyltransferase family 4 protein [Streptosporangiaceae bacterium]|nr:glycosyltransferase family 4 protein [Streptosporangiaceae bacterium]
MTQPRLALLTGTVSGGTGRHVAELAEGCRAAGLPVCVLGPAAARDVLGGGNSFSVVEIGLRPRPARDIAALAVLRRRLRAWRPDVVHAHGVRAGAFAALALGSLRRPGRRGPALVVTVHNAPPQGGLGGVYRVLARICARRSDAVLCASADLVADMRAAGATGAELFEVPAGPAPSPSADAVARAAADVAADGRPVVLAVGRLAPQKGFDVLIAAAARWRARARAPLTVIAGDGPLAGQLASQARQAGAEVLLLGRRDDVAALLAVADVFVLPSRWEARALVLQEAMQAGLPIVAARTGGTPGLTGEDAAVLVPPGDALALAEAVTGILDDPALAARLGLAARTRAASFPASDDAIAHALAVYRRVAADASGI